MEINKGEAQLSKDQIDQCISILETINKDTNQLFALSEEQRIELLTQAGRLSRPQRDEFKKRKKDAKKAAKRKAAEKNKHARNNTGIRSAREASVFVAPKMIALEAKTLQADGDTVDPRNCYVCNCFLRCTTFTIQCAKAAATLTMLNGFKPRTSQDKLPWLQGLA
jgi:hypothetical protein